MHWTVVFSQFIRVSPFRKGVRARQVIEKELADNVGLFLGRDIDGTHMVGLPFVINKPCENVGPNLGKVICEYCVRSISSLILRKATTTKT